MLLSKALQVVLLSAFATSGVSAVKTLYQSPETDGVSTWQDAKSFCEAKSSNLVKKSELCTYFKTTTTVSGDSWAPALDAPNEWLQIGSGESDYCEAYDKDKECPDTNAATTSPTEGGDGGLCSLPSDCTTPSCAYQCDLPEGYYPDPNDCRSYCKCTGTTAPSRYETVTGKDKIYDPWGVNYWTAHDGRGQNSFTPLARSNVPLGGMTGGIASHDYLNPDSQRGYCKHKYESNNWRTKRRRLSDPLSGRQLIESESERQLRTCEIDPNYIVCDQAPTGSSHGDPHFKTFGGGKFDFHGGCDLVLLDNPNFHNGLGMRIHVRTKIQTWWSLIEAAAIQVGNHTLEVRGGKKSTRYWLDGLAHELEDGEALFGDLHAKFKRITDHQSRIHIDLGGKGDAISFETFGDFVRVNVKAPAQENWHGSSGMLGSYPEGTMVSRDGSLVLDDANEFGQEWQVLSTEPMLFHEVSDTVQHPMKCLMPEDNMQAEKKRRLGESVLSKEDATLACAHVGEEDRNACVFDVLATNDVAMAGSY